LRVIFLRAAGGFATAALPLTYRHAGGEARHGQRVPDSDVSNCSKVCALGGPARSPCRRAVNRRLRSLRWRPPVGGAIVHSAQSYVTIRAGTPISLWQTSAKATTPLRSIRRIDKADARPWPSPLLVDRPFGSGIERDAGLERGLSQLLRFHPPCGAGVVVEAPALPRSTWCAVP
jgi:hypothetical protein